ncbi:MAG TPA: hypothetical protein VGY54_18260 [Polyangiaceae bacterium]|jgi:hypothetical protein|nr:hypothetical protein [Polyangiaceae bacterium]
MNWVPVRLEFLPPTEGGRTAPPTGDRYACTAVFAAPGAPREEWSVIFDLTVSPPRLRFLVDDAPSRLLVPGVRLELREGARPVGAALVRASLDDIDSALAHLYFVRAMTMVQGYQNDPSLTTELRDRIADFEKRARGGYELTVHRLETTQPMPPAPSSRPQALERQLTEYAEP